MEWLTGPRHLINIGRHYPHQGQHCRQHCRQHCLHVEQHCLIQIGDSSNRSPPIILHRKLCWKLTTPSVEMSHSHLIQREISSLLRLDILNFPFRERKSLLTQQYLIKKFVFKKLYDGSFVCWKYKDNITRLRSTSKHKECKRIIWGILNDSVNSNF